MFQKVQIQISKSDKHLCHTYFNHRTAPSVQGISPKKAFSSELFPLPVFPTIIVSLPTEYKLNI